MKNRTFTSRHGWAASVLALVALLGMGGCVGNESTPAPIKPLRVLFIGNSYTYVNMLPEMVQQFSKAGKQPRPLEYRMIAPGGVSLMQQWGQGLAQKAIAEGTWDYVVLQEQSLMSITSPTNTERFIQKFNQEIRKVGARTVVFITWARSNTPTQQPLLTTALSGFANQFGALSSPVGPAWAEALKQKPTLALHDKDTSHPSPAGTYLAACVFYQMLYSTSPQGLPNTVVGKDQDGKVVTLVALSSEDAAFLQQTAAKTVSEWNNGLGSAVTHP